MIFVFIITIITIIIIIIIYWEIEREKGPISWIYITYGLLIVVCLLKKEKKKGFGRKVRRYDFCVLSNWYSLVIKIIIIYFFNFLMFIYLINISLEWGWYKNIWCFVVATRYGSMLCRGPSQFFSNIKK